MALKSHGKLERELAEAKAAFNQIAKEGLKRADEADALRSSTGEPIGYVWPDMVEWLKTPPLAQKGGVVNLHRQQEDAAMIPVYVAAPSATRRAEKVTEDYIDKLLPEAPGITHLRVVLAEIRRSDGRASE